jgi:hypothetical protein
MGRELPLSAGGVAVDVAYDGGFDLVVVAACVGEGSRDGDLGHFRVIWVVVTGFDEGSHSDSDHEHLL